MASRRPRRSQRRLPLGGLGPRLCPRAVSPGPALAAHQAWDFPQLYASCVGSTCVYVLLGRGKGLWLTSESQKVHPQNVKSAHWMLACASDTRVARVPVCKLETGYCY